MTWLYVNGLQLGERYYLFKKLRYIARVRDDEPDLAMACPIIRGRGLTNMPEPSLTFVPSPLPPPQHDDATTMPHQQKNEDKDVTSAVVKEVFTGMSKEMFLELTKFFVG